MLIAVFLNTKNMEKTKFLNNGFQTIKEVKQSRIETKNGKEVKVKEVKCPLCGEIMRVSSWSLPSKEEEYSSPYYSENINVAHISSQGEICGIVTWTCPGCYAELKTQIKSSFRNDTMVYNLVPNN